MNKQETNVPEFSKHCGICRWCVCRVYNEDGQEDIGKSITIYECAFRTEIAMQEDKSPCLNFLSVVKG